MRVGVNGFFLSEPTTGSGQYVIGLLRALQHLQEENQVLVYDPRSGSEPGVAPSRLWAPHRSNVGKVLFEQVSVPLWCRRQRVELLHMPYFAGPVVGPRRTVITVHDLIMLAVPGYRGSVAVRVYTALACATARRASLLIADSECTRRDIMRFLRVPQERIRVIHLAADQRFRPVTDRDALEAVRRRYGLEREFVLYLGGLDRRKNVSTLISAWPDVKGPCELAIAGKTYSHDRTIFPDLELAAREAGVVERVRFLGVVSEEDKSNLYSAARLFVFPSLYEGFGLTPLEAMSCGTPVVCGNSSSIPEVVGDAAETCDTRNRKSLAEAINRVLGDPGRQREMRERGLDRAQRFTWERVAQETLAAYGEVIHG